MEKENKELEKKKKRNNYYTETWKNEIKLVEKERLLTEQERERIINAYENRNWKLIIMLCGLVIFLIAVLSVFFYCLGGIREAVINFILWTILAGVCIGENYVISDKIMKSAKKNEVYVREAVFLDSNKYHHVTFEVMEKGRWKLFFCDAALRENIKKRDVVILVKVRKKYVWVYKARK